MKNIYTLLAASLLCCSAGAQTASDAPAAATEPEKAFSGNFEWNYLRHYIWRGMVFGSNDVAQPELNFQWKGFSLGLAANINYKPSALPKEFYTRSVVFDEQDVEIGYSTSLKKFEFEWKAMAYFYINQINCPSTAELSTKISYHCNDQFTLFTEHVVDIASYRGAYFNNTGLICQFETGKNWSMEYQVYASSGSPRFNNVYFEAGTGGLNLIGGSASVTHDMGPVYMFLSGEYNQYMNKAVKASTLLNQTTNFSIGAGFNF